MMWDGHSRPGCKKACIFHFSTLKPQRGLYKKSTAIVEAFERWTTGCLINTFDFTYIFAFIKKHKHASGIGFDLHHRIPFTLTITSHSALWCSTRSKCLRDRLFLLAWHSITSRSLFSVFTRGGEERQTFNKSWKWALFRSIANTP